MMLKVIFYNLNHTEAANYEIYVPYWRTLEQILEIFNEQTGKDVEKVYNSFGQAIPLNYRIQKTNLELYY